MNNMLVNIINEHDSMHIAMTLVYGETCLIPRSLRNTFSW